jgi:hypothetical protein
MIRLPARIDLIKRLPAGSVVAEVGVLRGDFSAEILSCPNVTHLYLIDAWVKQNPRVYTDTCNDLNHDDNMRVVKERFAGERVTVIRGFSDDVALENTDIPPLDAVFIDSNHRFQFVLQDLILWEKRLKPTGILMGHDYTTYEALNFGTIKAVAEFCGHYPWELEVVTCEGDWPSFCLKRR